jgi:hypothetical protein
MTSGFITLYRYSNLYEKARNIKNQAFFLIAFIKIPLYNTKDYIYLCTASTCGDGRKDSELFRGARRCGSCKEPVEID